MNDDVKTDWSQFMSSWMKLRISFWKFWRRSVQSFPASRLIGRGIHWAYSKPEGYACPLIEATPRNISGFVVSTSKRCVWIYFRRRPQ